MRRGWGKDCGKGDKECGSEWDVKMNKFNK